MDAVEEQLNPELNLHVPFIHKVPYRSLSKKDQVELLNFGATFYIGNSPLAITEQYE